MAGLFYFYRTPQALRTPRPAGTHSTATPWVTLTRRLAGLRSKTTAWARGQHGDWHQCAHFNNRYLPRWRRKPAALGPSRRLRTDLFHVSWWNRRRRCHFHRRGTKRGRLLSEAI